MRTGNTMYLAFLGHLSMRRAAGRCAGPPSRSSALVRFPKGTVVEKKRRACVVGQRNRAGKRRGREEGRRSWPYLSRLTASRLAANEHSTTEMKRRDDDFVHPLRASTSLPDATGEWATAPSRRRGSTLKCTRRRDVEAPVDNREMGHRERIFTLGL
jgi:hypothetical protein